MSTLQWYGDGAEATRALLPLALGVLRAGGHDGVGVGPVDPALVSVSGLWARADDALQVAAFAAALEAAAESAGVRLARAEYQGDGK